MCQYLDVWGSKVGVFPLCVGTGLFCYVMLILYTLKKTGADEQKENSILCPLPFALMTGVLTAYLSDVVNRWDPELFCQSPFSFGITFYGFLMGMIGFTVIYAKIRRFDLLYFLNIYIPPLALAQFWGRIGCFFAGCCYGCPCSICGIVYPEKSLPFQRYGTVSLFPVQLLDAFYLFVVSMVLLKVRMQKRFACYLILVSFGRFITEFFRGDNRGQLAGCMILSPAQLLSIAIFAAGAFLFLPLFPKRVDNNN